MVQVDGRRGIIRNADGVRSSLCSTNFNSDYLALVVMRQTDIQALQVVCEDGCILAESLRATEDFPPDVLKEKQSTALLFKDLQP